MIVVCSVYDGNMELAKHTLRHAMTLDERVENDFLIVHPEGCDVSELKELLLSYVKTLKVVQHEQVESWPLGKNVAWQCAARTIFEGRRTRQWLWWEPDAIPLKKGWLKEIEAEAAGKEMLASVNGSGYFDGVAVYPGNVLERSMSAMLCRAAPFDQAAGKELGPFITPSKTIKSVWDMNGLPATFKTKQDVANICGNAALFHRCKDGSIANVMNETVIGRAVSKLKDMLAPVGQKSRVCVVMLGRYGDIINVLPVCKQLAQSGDKPGLMVAEQFKDLLDGVTYVQPEIFSGNFTDLKEAVKIAQSRYDKVLVGQVNSRNVGVNTECSTFTEESWRQMGFLEFFNSLPLVFDNRDREREGVLIAQHKKSKPVLLVNFSGKSSPFNDAPKLLAHLHSKWGNTFDIVSLGEVKAERVYDLLGLMDNAACLITIDTATLHLARASHVPMIALLAEQPTLWHGSRPKPGTLLARRYSEVMTHLEEIDGVLAKVVSNPSSIPLLANQTQWKTGQFALPLNKDISHFNPGLVRDGSGQLWLLSRKSVRNKAGKLDSNLLASKLTEDMRIISSIDVRIPKTRFEQQEDPRVIWANNRFYVTFCGWNRKPKLMPKQVVAIFDAQWKSLGTFQPQFGNNFTGSPGCEKNWAMFGHEGKFHFIYQFKPHLILRVEGEVGLTEFASDPKPSWGYGEIRGGTPPVRVGSEYLTFFHSSIPWRNGQRRYYMGAYTFSAEAPFRVLRMTNEPLLIGSENETRINGGPPVVFPCGAVIDRDEWLVTYGINDEACGWIRIPMKDLEERLCI